MGRMKRKAGEASCSVPQGFEYQSGICGGSFGQKNISIAKEVAIKNQENLRVICISQLFVIKTHDASDSFLLIIIEILFVYNFFSC